MNGDDEKEKSADGEANISSPAYSGNNIQTQDEKTISENRHDKTSEGAKGSGNESSNARTAEGDKINENTEISAKEFTEKNITSSFQEEKQEEDIPEDFFDDFLKEDFMAGLDIVDEDDEPDEKHTSESSPKSERKNAIDHGGPKSHMEKIDHVKKFRESPSRKKIIKKRQTNKVNDEELKKLNAKLEELKKARPKNIEKLTSGIDADNFDIRRDPEKTRQAIQRDKIKSAKDKEKRLITDIVETGLVPPGMELEVDIDEVRRQDRIENKFPIGDLREKLAAKKTRSQSRDKPKTSGNKRTPPSGKKFHSPPKRRRSRTPKKDTTTSALALSEVPGKKPILDSQKKRSTSRRSPNQSMSRRSQHSPLSRRTPLGHSPRLQRSPLRHRSPLMRRSPLVHRSPLRRSPVLQRRTRSRSPRKRSNISPALWSRNPLLHRRSRSRDHSTAYRRKRDRSYGPLERARWRRTRSRSPKVLPRKEEKFSFLEELAVKLNEAHQPSHLPQTTWVQSAPVPYVLPTPPQQIIAPVPAPVPPPQAGFFSAASTIAPQLQPVEPITQQYDQSFDQYDQNFFIGISAALPQRERPPTVPRALESNGYDTGLNIKEDVTKLFGDKRIKLSDFLAITAKPQVSNSSPVKLQEKIKVIQQCQEAIKLLNEKRFTGPLVIHKTNSYQSSKNMTMSPLLRKPIIQLPFTTPGLKKSTEIDFAKCCETLLYRLGIEKTPPIPKEPEKPKVIPSKELPQKEIAPPIFPIKQTYSEPTPIKLITKTFGTQTDKELSSCKECLRRKGILYANCGVQAGNPTLTFSVSTQVTEADFYSMIPKTQSLASLTPAQLLGKQSMISDHSRVGRSMPTPDSMPRMNFQVPSPPPPPSFFIPLAPQPPKISQRETSSYRAPLINQPSATPLMSIRPFFGDNKNQTPFPDNRRGSYNNKF